MGVPEGEAAGITMTWMGGDNKIAPAEVSGVAGTCTPPPTVSKEENEGIEPPILWTGITRPTTGPILQSVCAC